MHKKINQIFLLVSVIFWALSLAAGTKHKRISEGVKNFNQVIYKRPTKNANGGRSLKNKDNRAGKSSSKKQKKAGKK